MNKDKKVELNSYARTDENHGDYMVYEIKYANGYKEYVSRDVFRKLKALEIIKEKCLKIDFKILLASTDYETYCFMLNSTKYLTKEEYDLLKEVLL